MNTRLGLILFIAVTLFLCAALVCSQEEKTFPLLGVVYSKDEREVFGQLAFSPDGRLLASLTQANPDADSEGMRQSVIIFDACNLKRKATIKPPAGDICSIAFSPLGKTIAVAHSSSISLYDSHTGRFQKSIFAGRGAVPIRFSPDGSYIVCSDIQNRAVLLLDSVSGATVKTLTGEALSFERAAFSSDGALLAASAVHDSDKEDGYSPSTLTCWDTISGKKIGSVRKADPSLALEFIPGKHIIVSAGVNGVSWRDARTLKELKKRESGPVGFLAIDCKARYAAAIYIMETYAELYSLEPWKKTGRTRRFCGHGNSVIFSPGGKHLAASLGASLVLYDITRTVPMKDGEP